MPRFHYNRCGISSRLALATGLLASLAGCPAGRQQAETTTPKSSSKILILAVSHDCCQAGRRQALEALEQALQQHAEVATLNLTQDPGDGDRSPELPSVNAELFRATIKRANDLYLTMRMDKARKLLVRLLTAVKKTHARGLTPADLAQVHLSLAAVSHARRWKKSFRRHCATAAGYDPNLPLDPDTFSPPVQEAIEKAKESRSSMAVAIRSIPPGAEVFWDGLKRGPTPTTIQDQAKGKHYLIVEHPLYQPWREEIHLTTAAELQVKLKPGSTEQIIKAMARRPDLRSDGISLLGVGSVVWVSPDRQGLGLEVQTPGSRGAHTFSLEQSSSDPEVERMARRIATLEGPVPTPPAPVRTTTASPPVPYETKERRGPSRGSRPSLWKRYWWAWALAGSAVLATSIVLPVTLSGAGGDDGRDVLLTFPK